MNYNPWKIGKKLNVKYNVIISQTHFLKMRFSEDTTPQLQYEKCSQDRQAYTSLQIQPIAWCPRPANSLPSMGNLLKQSKLTSRSSQGNVYYCTIKPEFRPAKTLSGATKVIFALAKHPGLLKPFCKDCYIDIKRSSHRTFCLSKTGFCSTPHILLYLRTLSYFIHTSIFSVCWSQHLKHSRNREWADM